MEQQAATSKVLQVISSSPGELEPVFQTILANAARLCGAKFGALSFHENGVFHPAAMFNLPPALAQFYHQRGSFQPAAGTALERLWRAKKTIHSPDILAEMVLSPAAKLGGARSYIAVPMLKEKELIGAFVIYRTESAPSPTNRSSCSGISPRRPSSPSRTPACSTSFASAPTISLRPWSSRRRPLRYCVSSPGRLASLSPCLAQCWRRQRSCARQAMAACGFARETPIAPPLSMESCHRNSSNSGVVRSFTDLPPTFHWREQSRLGSRFKSQICARVRPIWRAIHYQLVLSKSQG